MDHDRNFLWAEYGIDLDDVVGSTNAMLAKISEAGGYILDYGLSAVQDSPDYTGFLAQITYGGKAKVAG